MELLTRCPELDVCGLSVTAPHKEHAFRWLARRGMHISDAAQRCGQYFVNHR